MRSITIDVNDDFSMKVTEEGVQLDLVGVGSIVLTHEEFDRIKILPFCSFQAAFRAYNPALNMVTPQGLGAYNGGYPAAVTR